MIKTILSEEESRRLDILRTYGDVFDFITFKDAISKTFSLLIDNLNEINSKETKLSNMKVSNFDEDNNGIPTQEDEDIFRGLNELRYDRETLNERLTALSEMKVIYLYKSLEIGIKSIVRSEYPTQDITKFYILKNIVSFFQSKNIVFENLNGYLQVEELLDVNNNIKHGSKIFAKVKEISEFKDKTELNYENIEAFYNRIKSEVQAFSFDLCSAVFNSKQ